MTAAIISAMSAVLVAFIAGVFARSERRNKAQHEKSEARAELRARESRLSMDLMSASVALGVATALAVQEQKLNGEMHDAILRAADAQRQYRAFVNSVAAEQIVKN